MVEIVQFNYEELTNVVRNCLKEAIFEIRSLPSPEEINDRILFPEACKITDLSESAMRKLCMDNKIPFEKYGSRRVVFSRKRLAEWMKARTKTVTDPDAVMSSRLQKSAKRKLQ
jgi:excisionase family DNA binding protein